MAAWRHTRQELKAIRNKIRPSRNERYRGCRCVTAADRRETTAAVKAATMLAQTGKKQRAFDHYENRQTWRV